MQINTRVIAIANQKGGVGKTTTVVNLAAALSRMHRTVLVIDLDPQANATTGLGLQPQEGVSLYPCLIGTQQIADMIQPTPYENLNVIPSEVLPMNSSIPKSFRSGAAAAPQPIGSSSREMQGQSPVVQTLTPLYFILW